MTSSHYVHGTDPVEQARLSRLNDLINARCLEGLRIGAGESVLDVGSGLGQLTRAIARAAGAAGKTASGPGAPAASGAVPRVIGIERSEEQRAEALRQADLAGEASLVEFRPGDALDMPLADAEWGSFDVAHTRFLLEHVPDPLAVVRQMLRAVRPGGRLLLLDDDHDLLRLWPEPPGLITLWNAYQRSYDRLGNDPIVGRRLVQLLHQAGAEPARCEWLFFGASAGDPSFPGFVENLARVLDGARGAVLGTGGVEPDQFDGTLAALRDWGTRPDAAIWYAVSLAEGRRPA